MNKLNTTSAKIQKLIDNQYETALPFEKLVSELQQLAIVRFSLDAFTNQMFFYSKNRFIHSLIRKDLSLDQSKTPYNFGEALDFQAMKKNLHDFDNGNLSVCEFHRRMASSGVVSCIVYIEARKIFYMGQDGQYFLENF